MLTALVLMIVVMLTIVGFAAYPAHTVGIVALAISIMMFPLWALAIFTVFVALFSLLWVNA